MILASTDEYDIALAAMLIGMFVSTTWIIAHYWHRVRVAAYDARLKQLMIERGMSASEIERVLQAGGARDRGKRLEQRTIGGIGLALGADCCSGGKTAKESTG